MNAAHLVPAYPATAAPLPAVRRELVPRLACVGRGIFLGHLLRSTSIARAANLTAIEEMQAQRRAA
jgi:hypothetical protein